MSNQKYNQPPNVNSFNNDNSNNQFQNNNNNNNVGFGNNSMNNMNNVSSGNNNPFMNNNSNSFGSKAYSNRRRGGGRPVNVDPKRGYLKEVTFPSIDQKKKVMSVVVTTFDGSSYDNLFRKVPQNIPEGRVVLYALQTRGIQQLINIFSGRETIVEDEVVKKFLMEVASLDPDCILFNWECCQGCSDRGFPNGQTTMELINILINKGHILMFSDFAVKSLIAQWDEKLLGPNPFVKSGECSTSIELRFRPDVLEKSEIPQLQAVGKLCDKGQCVLKCLGGTVVVSVDWKKIAEAKNKYRFEVLTIASKVDGRAPREDGRGDLCEVEEYRGNVGHCVLKFQNGGDMIISSGHWIELSRLDTSFERVTNFAQQYGNEFSEDVNFMNDSMNSMASRNERMRQVSNRFVQQMPACRNRGSNPVYRKNNF